MTIRDLLSDYTGSEITADTVLSDWPRKSRVSGLEAWLPVLSILPTPSNAVSTFLPIPQIMEESEMADETYSHEGPKCPHCGRQYTADDPVYYDEMNYTEETCDECGKVFDVRVYHSVSWTCSPKGGQ